MEAVNESPHLPDHFRLYFRNRRYPAPVASGQWLDPGAWSLDSADVDFMGGNNGPCTTLWLGIPVVVISAVMIHLRQTS